MKSKISTMNQIVEDQIQAWLRMRPEEKRLEIRPPAITISREPGSGGNVLGQMLADLSNRQLR